MTYRSVGCILLYCSDFATRTHSLSVCMRRARLQQFCDCQPTLSYVCMQTRVHCSLNINTETGRLSARRPSLQNQPALEKDRYKVLPAQYLSLNLDLAVAEMYIHSAAGRWHAAQRK